MNIRHSLYLNLHRERGGSYSVTARIIVRGMRPVNCGLGISLRDRSEWDTRRRRVLPKSTEAHHNNLILSDLEASVTAFFVRMETVEKRTPTRDEVVAMLRNAAGRTDGNEADQGTVDAALASYMARERDAWAEGTARKYRSLRRHLNEYDTNAKMSDIDTNWMDGFVKYLLHSKCVRNVTAVKYLKALKAFLRASGMPADYRPRLRGGESEREIVYLTADELRRMETAELDGIQNAVRDTFVFCCYTGLRYGDAKRLRHTDDRGDHIEVVTAKTGERLKIELNRHARAILDRYRRNPDRALPAVSNPYSNRHLKAIAHACRIDTPVRLVWYEGSERVEKVVEKWRLVTTHTARRTFVVTALTLGIPAEVIMRWTGHSDYQSMRPYVAIVDELKKREMEKFNGI